MDEWDRRASSVTFPKKQTRKRFGLPIPIHFEQITKIELQSKYTSANEARKMITMNRVIRHRYCTNVEYGREREQLKPHDDLSMAGGRETEKNKKVDQECWN